MRLVKLAEMRQLLHAGAAVGGPEIDEHGLAAIVGKVELAPVKAGDGEVGELIAHLAAEGRVACKRRGGGGGLSAGGRLLIQSREHLRRHTAALVVYDLALPVEDDGLRHGGGPAHEVPDHLVLILHRKGHDPVLAELVQVLLRIVSHDIRVQGQHGDVVLMRLVKLAEMRQLLHAGAAVGGPEVDKHRLAAIVGKVELAPVKAGDSEVGELIAHLAAEGRVARPVCHRCVRL